MMTMWHVGLVALAVALIFATAATLFMLGTYVLIAMMRSVAETRRQLLLEKMQAAFRSKQNKENAHDRR